MDEAKKEAEFALNLHGLIFEYLEKEFGITEKDRYNFGSKTMIIALFVKKRKKKLLELLKEYA